MIPVNIRNDFAHAGVHKLIVAESQTDTYDPLPGLYYEREGYLLTEWSPTPEERAKLAAGGRVRLFTYTFGQKLQPLQMVAVGPDEALPLETVS